MAAPRLGMAGCVAALLSLPFSAAAAGGYDLCFGTYSVGGYKCQTPSGEDDTKVFFPCGETAAKAFPAVLYAHGTGGRGEVDSLEGPIKAVVSMGFIVIAPYTSDDGCDSTTEYLDLLRAASVSETTPGLHKALPRVSWDRIGVWGSSMGGKTTPLAVASPSLQSRVFAMVCAYGARNSSKVSKTPSMYITGTEDQASSPADVMKAEFTSNPSKHKVFLNLQGVGHMGNFMDEWLAKFIACHVGEQDTCGDIYGADHAICGAASYAKDGCLVEPPSSASASSASTEDAAAPAARRDSGGAAPGGGARRLAVLV